MTEFQPPPTRTELIWAGIDFDGTLAHSEGPDFTPRWPIWRNVAKLLELKDAGYKIAIHTARGWEDYELVEAWLRHFEIPFDRIVMGKLLAAVYCDDRARHSDEETWFPHGKDNA